MPIDVRPDHLVIIQSILKTFVPDHRVVAFGSRVTQSARNTSDLDLCIMGSQQIPFEILAHLRDAFSESNIPYKVDIIDGSTLAADFKQIILEKCVDIQSNSCLSDQVS